MFKGFVKDDLKSMETLYTKSYITYKEAHDAAEELCKVTMGDRGSIDVLAIGFEPAGTWWNGNQEQIKKDGRVYALHGWSGESYADSWQVVDGTEAVGSYDIRPVYVPNTDPDDLNDFDILDYEIIER